MPDRAVVRLPLPQFGPAMEPLEPVLHLVKEKVGSNQLLSLWAALALEPSKTVPQRALGVGGPGWLFPVDSLSESTG